jgi:hypothetical protein
MNAVRKDLQDDEMKHVYEQRRAAYNTLCDALSTIRAELSITLDEVQSPFINAPAPVVTYLRSKFTKLNTIAKEAQMKARYQ